jgi:hypothetical protein
MPAAYTNIYIEQGATFSTSITLDDVYGDAYNLVGYTANSQIRKSYYSSNATATFTASTSATEGIIYLTLSAATTANIAAGRYVYDAKITGSDSSVTRVLEGIVEVSPSVTR